MNKLLTTTALALLLGTGFALAAEEPGQPGQSDPSVQNGQPPTAATVTPDTAEEAAIPDEGEADTSGGAKERSSAPPESGAVIGEDTGDDANDDAMSGAKKSQAEPPEDQSDTSME